MKTLVVVILTSLLGLSNLLAQTDSMKDKTDESKLSKIVENTMEQGLLEGRKNITPKLLEGELYSFANSFYLDGTTKIDALDYFECKFNELVQFEKIRESIKDPGKMNCYQNFIDEFAEGCVLNWTKDHIYPVVNSSAQSFEQKYKCNGKHETDTYKGESDFDLVKSLYLTLYTKLYGFYLKKVQENPKEKADEYQLATHRFCKEALEKRLYVDFKNQSSCKEQQKECSKHSDCCSEVCIKSGFSNKGKCSEAYSCYTLLKEGEQCGVLPSGYSNPYCDSNSKNLACLEVNYDSSSIGECTRDGQKPSEDRPCCSDKVSENGLCLRNQKCSSCLQSGAKPSEDEQCCEGLYKDLNGTCVQDFPPFGAIDENPVQKNTLQNFVTKLINFFIPAAHAQSTCVAGVSCEQEHLEQSHLDQGADCFEKREDGTRLSGEDLEKCLKEKRNFGYEMANERIADEAEEIQTKRSEYLINAKGSQINDVVAKSSYETCQFNLFEDTFFRQSSNLAKNAELMIRGFEFIYSGEGTIDFWIDKSKRSIFEKAQKIALRYRKFRSEMIDNLNKSNQQLKCQCIAMQGISKFPGEQNFMNSQCSAQEKQLYASNPNQKSDAVGLRSEQLIQQYLQEKMKFNFAAFNEYEDIKEDLEELATYVREMKWEKAWDRQDFVYDFKARKYADWAHTVLGIFTLGIGTMIADAILDPRYEKMEKKLGQRSVNIFPSLTGGRLMHVQTRDYHVGKEERQERLDMQYKYFKRYYVGPYFKASESDDINANEVPIEKDCNIFASSRSCIRNIHKVTFEEEERFLLDAKFPEFVSSNAYDKESGLIEKINQAHVIGVDYIKSYNPHNRITDRMLDIDKAIEKEEEFDSLTPPKDEVARKFAPDEGNWQPKEFNGEAAFKAALVKYAGCKNLKECGAKHIGENEQDALYGFGHIFSSQADMNSYADYLYHSHFLWPSLSAYKDMSYPTQATVAYFETLTYMVDILLNSAADRGLGAGEAFDVYEADYAKKSYDYQATGGIKTGNRSKNIKYSQKFRNMFRKLNFSQNASLDHLLDKNGQLKDKSNNFSEAENLALVNAAQNSALNHRQAKRKEHYEQVVGQTARAKAKMNAREKMLAKYASPLSTVSLTKNGRQYGKLGSKGYTTSSPNLSPNKELAVFAPSARSLVKFKPNRAKNYAKPSKATQYSRADKKFNQDSPDNFIPDQNKLFQRENGDSLFRIVSKAYGRNLSRIFTRKNQHSSGHEFAMGIEDNKSISDQKKKKLEKLLLEQNSRK